MNRNRAMSPYLVGTLGQIWTICFIVFILCRCGITVDYTSSDGMVAIALGGISSALWGTIITIKYKQYDLKKILKDFFV